MTSTRLPGKVLAQAEGQPLLAHMIARLRRCQQLDEIVVATTVRPTDDPVADLARGLGAGVFRGSEEDVLSRVLGAARAYDAELIVETSADCPLIDPEVVGEVISRFADGDADYCSNTLERTYPRGMDVQVFPTAVLGEVDRLTDDPADREHVSLYIYEHPERYRLRSVTAAAPRHTDARLTVDTPEDLALIRAILAELSGGNPAFGLSEILDLLDARPDLLALNSSVEQKPVR
jgi:spore coat polysaccharide biosynthesis protein SpsF